MKAVKVAIPVLILLGGLAAVSVPSPAKVEYSKKEKTGCTTCHVKMGSKELNDVGKKYKETGKLEKKS